MQQPKKLRALFILFIFLYNDAISQKQQPVLNHIAVYVTNLKTSTAFYNNIIQLDTIANPFNDGKHTWFNAGNGSHIHLIEEAAIKTDHPKHNHICFSVNSVQAFTAVLDQNKVEYENWAGEKHNITKRADGAQQVYFKDPDGYWIEINDATK